VKASSWPPIESICLRDVFRRPLAGALEQHVLDEMGDAAALSRFVPRPARQPDADADRTDLRHPLGQNPEPVVETSLTMGVLDTEEARRKPYATIENR
jgi:hypothetical protein